MLHFLSDLLRPFQIGPGHFRVALVQVHTDPRLEFNFDEHSSQNSLQDSLLRIQQLRGDTMTKEALQMARERVLQPAGQKAPPRVLLWVTDGVDPGNIEGPLAALRREGVSVLVVSTGHTNYQVFRRVVTPPVDQHLHFVDADSMDIITKDLRDAITGENYCLFPHLPRSCAPVAHCCSYFGIVSVRAYQVFPDSGSQVDPRMQM